MRPEQSKPASPAVGPSPPHWYGSPIWAIATPSATAARASGSESVNSTGTGDASGARSAGDPRAASSAPGSVR
ncbi:hypothetical protein [Pseudonocardia sp. T1-2H]|uniref:hypothetical protein n=1 Tax=Pseudonocardia sp. T1-2H TaxID=3128899 RepID=UPI00310163A6